MTVGIVYYSRSGNTSTAAKMLQAKLKERNVDSQLIEIEAVKRPMYLKAGYAGFRQKELPIKNTGFDLKDFDTLLIGVPIWAGRPAPFYKTFFHKAMNGKGKKTAFYVTCGGIPSSQTTSQEMMKDTAQQSGYTPIDAFLPLQMMNGEIKDGTQIIDHFLTTVLTP